METDSEVTRLTIRPPHADEGKDTSRNFYHTMVQLLKAIFIYVTVFSAILILCILVWGAVVISTIYVVNALQPMLNTVL